MKFEMVSGDEKLFDGAPDWAEIVYSATSEAGQLKAFSGRGKYQYINGYSGDMDPGEVIISTFETGWYDNPKNIAERRPISDTDPKQSTEWNGEGLPPVGVECEFQAALGNWVAIRITAHGEDSMLMKQVGKDNEQYISKGNNFRPIPSPEEIARDEAVNDMAQIIEYRTGCSPKPLAGWLYDAGYRKLE